MFRTDAARHQPSLIISDNIVDEYICMAAFEWSMKIDVRSSFFYFGNA